MKANELKTGNWVLNKETGSTYRVGEILRTGIRTTYVRQDTGKEHTSLIPYELLCGILLTPEIIQDKCGFTYVEGKASFEGLEVNLEPYYELSYMQLYKVLTNDERNLQYQLKIGNRFVAKTFSYLHQIQNLYYLLTQEELEIINWHRTTKYV